MLRLFSGFNIDNRFSFGDKSITHRALIFASIAKGKSVIKNANICADTLATLQCLRQLGAKITVKKGEKIVVTPIKKPNDNLVFDCKNSGTTARLLAGLAVGLNLNVRFCGDESLQKRPFKRVIDPLKQMGASIKQSEGCLFEALKVDKPLKAICYTLPVASAQVKSAILIAGLFAEGTTTVVENTPSRNHTENLLRHQKAKITVSNGKISVEKSTLKPFKIFVPNDTSTATFFVAAALQKNGTKLKNVGLNETRTGAFEVLKKSGADITFQNIKTKNFEKFGDIVVRPSVLKPLTLCSSDVPRTIDEVPILAALACTTAGESRFLGVSELRLKESDRLKGIQNLVEFCHQKATIDGDNLTILSNGKVVLSDAVAQSMNDHRLAMSFAILGVLFGAITISDATCIDVSCLKFFDILGAHVHNFALIGSSVATSLSQKLFLHFADVSKLNVEHTLCGLSSDASDKQLEFVFNSFDGVNVTTPFKKRAAKLLNSNVDSVNTVLPQGTAVSTDGFGVVKSLQNAGVNLVGAKILLVGAGATAESTISALLNEGAKVNVVNRTAQKAAMLQKKFCIDYQLDSFDGIVSCVPVCDFENQIPLENVSFVMSVEYKQSSNLLARAREKGIKTIDGLPMLYFQGKRSFELWTGVVLPNTLNQFLEEVKK